MLNKRWSALLGAGAAMLFLLLGVGCGGGGGVERAEPLDPSVLYAGDCSYLDGTVFNTLFDNLPAKAVPSPNPILQTELWEFNNPGRWLPGPEACTWNSSNTDGVLLVIVGAEIPPDAPLDDPSESEYFLQDVDDFASVGTRLNISQNGTSLADEAVILGSSNYGEGGIALRWNFYAVHVHLSLDGVENLDVQLRTEEAVEFELAKYLLLRFEEFEGSNE